MRVIDTPEVARILGVSRARVAELMTEQPGFPPAGFPSPHVAPAGNRVWRQESILRWADAHPDQRQRGDRPELPVYGRPSLAAERLFQPAYDQARHLHHPWVGPDHLLLAILRSECGGAARGVLESFRLSAEELEEDLVESMGDPFEASDLEPKTEAGARIREERRGRLRDGAASRLLRLASLKAGELQDEVVASEHVLLALTECCELLKMRGIDEATVRVRVLAITEGALTSAELSATASPAKKRLERYVGPELARSPEGRDPWRRRPWGGILLHDADGSPIERDGRMLHYFVDRDGSPVLSKDGDPIRMATEDGNPRRDKWGDRIYETYALPLEVTLRSHPRDLLLD